MVGEIMKKNIKLYLNEWSPEPKIKPSTPCAKLLTLIGQWWEKSNRPATATDYVVFYWSCVGGILLLAMVVG